MRSFNHVLRECQFLAVDLDKIREGCPVPQPYKVAKEFKIVTKRVRYSGNSYVYADNRPITTEKSDITVITKVYKVGDIVWVLNVGGYYFIGIDKEDQENYSAVRYPCYTHFVGIPISKIKKLVCLRQPTYKDIIKAYEPESIGDEYVAGISGCPYAHGLENTKPCDNKKRVYRSDCVKCWNRKIKKERKQNDKLCLFQKLSCQIRRRK